MKSYRILVGIPTGGSVQALTVQSLVDLVRMTRQVGDCLFRFHFAGCFCGPYVQWNVGHIFEFMRRENLAADRRHESAEDRYVGVLRIDSDMSWTDEWVMHFLRALGHLLEHQSPETEGGPWALGGIYPRRQPLSLHVPVVAMYDPHAGAFNPPAPAKELDYLHWAWACYEAGATVRVGRIGGGFTFYSAGVAEIPEERWTVQPGIGEDYALCQAIHQMDGPIYGCWPLNDAKTRAPIPVGAQLYHGIGHELHTLECYFKAAREAGLHPDGASAAELLAMHNYGRTDSIFEMRRPGDES